MDNKDEKFSSLVEMYEEIFDCSSQKMKEYLEKRIQIEGWNLKEQDKIEHLYEIRDALIDNFTVMEWDTFIDACEYFEGKNEKK